MSYSLAQLPEKFKSGRLLQFSNREIILKAGEQPPGVYFLASGFIKVYSISEHGEENIHVIYRPGEVFPLIWAFKNIVRGVFYESLGPTKLWCLPKDDFLHEVKTSLPMANVILGQLVEQFHIFADRLDNLEYNEAEERVIYRLLFLAGRFGKKLGAKVIIDAPITHQHIASSINLARETVSREIEKLEDQGLVEHQKRRIILKNVAKLEQLIGEPTSLNLWGLK